MQNIDISKIDDKNISFNGKSCAAVYKAKAGSDEKGEFVLISEIDGEYKGKHRIENLTVNSKPCRSADSAASELNQLVGNFKKGGGGEKGSEPTEGEWKPTILVNGYPHPSAIYLQQRGYYQREGKRVYLSFHLKGVYNDIPPSGAQLGIAGLPFKISVEQSGEYIDGITVLYCSQPTVHAVLFPSYTHFALGYQELLTTATSSYLGIGKDISNVWFLVTGRFFYETNDL